jgi:2',3'-cyclic-nucleotide 2'-phosphodiesterase/3'-nucleotidase/5'-nucleotidase
MMHRLSAFATSSALLFYTLAATADGHLVRPLSTYETDRFDESAAEIVAFAPGVNRLFITNADANTIDVLDLSDPGAISKQFEIDLSPYGDGVNSVAYNASNGGYIAVAVESDPKQDPGSVVFFDLDGNVQKTLTVGALPDMLTFTPDGNTLLVANEGEPNDDYTVDPEGSVSIIDVSDGIADLSDRDVVFATFNDYDDIEAELVAAGVRIFGPGASVSEDLEPEYIAVSADSQTAYIALQEANALGVLDLTTQEIEVILPLGTKNHALGYNGYGSSNALDASNKDDGINIQNWPVYGLYQPDAIATYSADGKTYIVTANEGDSRDYEGFSEEERVKDVELDPKAFRNAEALQASEHLGRLKITTTLGDTDGDGDFDKLYSYGARSFSIWDEKGELVWDSGDQFEQILAEQLSDDFNSTNDANQSMDNRSDDKGPEPEGITVGTIGDRTFAFIGLERVGGIMVYDVTAPASPTFVTYVNNRNFEVEFDVELDDEGKRFLHQPLHNWQLQAI